MKIKSVLICFSFLMLLASPAAAADVCSHVTLNWIGSHVPVSPESRIVLKRPSGEFCEVVIAVDGNLAPVYAGKSSLVAGRLFRDRVPVTQATMNSLSEVAETERKAAEEKKVMAEERRKGFFRERHKDLAPLVSMTFGPGQSSDFLYVITDPNCSHCKAMLPELEALAFEAKLKLKLIIFPLLSAKSRDMTAHILCKEFNYADYREMDLPETLVNCGAADEKISKTMELMRSADVSFVPMVVASDGAWLVEGNDMCQVRTHLGIVSDADDGDGDACGEK
ncbi:MAG: thioredoxin fold domain-containing protein [Desulfobacterales bacterium]|nr:thioredoxin fold domain-containing protein [Desulfobacterales bacterium]